MKRFLAIALAATVGLAIAGAAQAAEDAATNVGSYEAATGSVAAYTVGMSANGVKASRHNLGATGMFITVSADLNEKSTTEICVFCHTPHHSISTTGATTQSTGAAGVVTGVGVNSTGDYSPAPLWNRRSAASSFTTYGTTTGGVTLAGTAIGQIGGVTLACLSCHDGITTFDNLANGPGPGHVAADDKGTGPYGSAVGQGWRGIDEGGEGGVKSFGQNGEETRVNIGNMGSTLSDSAWSSTDANLSNDHPVSVDYMEGTAASLRMKTTRIDSINLRAGLFTTVQEIANNLGQNRWAVKGFISTSATIADLLRLNKVECSSCHDPHFKNLSNVDINITKNILDAGAAKPNDPSSIGDKTAGGVGVSFAVNGGTIKKTDGLFLRRVGGNAGSGVCRTCHNK